MKLNIGVIVGGPSPEHEISILTGLQAGRVLEEKHKVSIIYWSKDNEWYLNSTDLEGEDFLDTKKVTKNSINIQLNDDPGFYLKKKNLEFDVLVNACHGGPGEDGTLQSLLDIINIPYTGPNSSLAQICMDKYLFTLLLKNSNLPVLDRVMLKDEMETVDMNSPYILKPRFGGSSIGVEVVKDLDTAKSLVKNSNLYSRGAILEEYLEDSEDYLIAAFGYPDLNLSEIEKPIRDNTASSIYNYQDKYLRNGGLEESSRELPARLIEKDKNEIISLTKKLIELIGVRGVYRIDFLKKDHRIYINEVNSIPGSLSTYLWKNTNLTKFSIIENIVQEALEFSTNEWDTTGSDGNALVKAKDIESKLG
jgi:D-alanine-D-alanine ligase